ncbi:hypothetical protein ACH5RR_027953 [Cinchona calisaya]|uniref:FBD domain-containing protein n=1 Tax=Cinchona calisaya TaxID=153742 RepID=A0ABD2YQL7_9GENT
MSSFDYKGPKISTMIFKDVPQLSSVSLLVCPVAIRENDDFCNHLVVTKFNQGILLLCSLLHASPALHELVVRYSINWFSTQMNGREPSIWEYLLNFGEKRGQMVKGWKYECLEESVNLDTQDQKRMERWKRIRMFPFQPSAQEMKFLKRAPSEIVTKAGR